MPHSKQKISYKRLLGALVALIAFFMLLTSVIGLAEKYFAIKGRTRELKTKQAKLEEKELALMEQNSYLETPDGQQQSLRAKFNVVKPGEEMIIITAPVVPEPVPVKEQSRIGHWWEAILRGLGFKKD
ncbi:MAG TPA: hypothetical protein VGE18_01975 [Candidatus Paceibacterota bacterium]